MNRFKTCRTNMNDTQKKMADFLGIDRTTYVKYETGASEPTFATISTLAEFFNVSTDYLLGREPLSPRVVSMSPAPCLAPNEEQLIAVFRKLTPAGQAAIQAMIETYAANPAVRKDTLSEMTE